MAADAFKLYARMSELYDEDIEIFKCVVLKVYGILWALWK